MTDESHKSNHRMAWIAFAATILGALITASGTVAVAWLNGTHRTDDPSMSAKIAAGFQYLANRLADRSTGTTPLGLSQTPEPTAPTNESKGACSGDNGWLHAKLNEATLNSSNYNVTIEISALPGHRVAIATLSENGQNPTLSANNGDHSMGYVSITLPSVNTNGLVAAEFYEKMPKITDSPTAVIASFYIGAIPQKPPATAIDVNIPLEVAREEGSKTLMERIYISCLRAPVRPKMR